MPLLSGLFSLANGIGQSIKGHNMNPVRPDYEIPEETKRALGLRQLLLNAGLPGEQQYEQNINTNQANTLSGLARAASDQSQLLSGLGAVQGQTNNALANLETARAENYMNNVAGLEGAQQQMATAKNTQWQLNEYLPYLQQLARKKDLINSGNQNISSGLSAIEPEVSDIVGAVTGGKGIGGLASFALGAI